MSKDKLSIKAVITELRIWQWGKNFLAFLPLLFGFKLLQSSLLINVILIFFSFCFAASSVYIMNDIFDLETDRSHPLKKNRPIANGSINTNIAVLISLALFLISLILAKIVSSGALIILFSYFLINILYSKKLKHIAIADILLVAVMYLLRIYAGGVAAGVSVSGWLLLTTLFASLFLIIGKRRSEFISAGNSEIYARKVLNSYNKEFLDGALLLSATLFLISYSLYAVNNHGNIFALSIIIVLYGALRYLYLIYAKNLGEEPDKLVFKDKELLSSGLILIAFMVVTIYFGDSLNRILSLLR